MNAHGVASHLCGVWSLFRLDSGVEHGLLLLEVEYQAQLGQGQAGGTRQTKQSVVQIDRVTPQPPVMRRTWGNRVRTHSTLQLKLYSFNQLYSWTKVMFRIL